MKRLRGRYGKAGRQPLPSEYGMSTHDLGNNESAGTGISHNAGQSSPWLALTRSQSKWFGTFRGAAAWLAKRGYDPHGRRIK